jgi:O-antigen ligase
MVLSGLELGFFVEKYAGRGAATVTFVNTYHLAGYLVMCLAAGAGLLVAELEAPVPPAATRRERLRRWLRYLLGPRMRLRFLLALMVVALIMTRSRAGNLAFLGSLALAGGCLLATGRRPSGPVAAFLASLVLVDVLVLGRWFGLDRVLARVTEIAAGPVDRLAYFPAVLDYVASFPLTGSGGGSFYAVMPNFEPPGLGGVLEHAHNDYLEFAAELGLPALALLAAVVGASAWQGWRVLRERRRGVLRGAGFCCLMVICWSLLHSAVDFNLQIPANALTYCTVLALPWICRGLPRADRAVTGPARVGL